MSSANAIVHAGPAMGARFAEYSVELDAGGFFNTTQQQTFLYVIDGQITVGTDRLGRSDYLYLPPGQESRISAAKPSRIAVIEKPWAAIEGGAPQRLRGNDGQMPGSPMQDDETIEVRKLIPEQCAFDFAVNTMTFEPGAQLPMVEIHVMEHGLLMLEGEGVYRLGDHWYNVSAGDFIWMAPYCPQWFGALGRKPAKYLIYKDWNRHPMNL
jgi:(S)-ureidoglycine aminohydrolase